MLELGRARIFSMSFDASNKDDPHVANRRFVYHSLLFEILRGDVVASDFEEFFCDENCNDDPEGEGDRHSDELDGLRREAAALKPAIRKAVQASPGIDNTKQEEYIERISIGDEDATLALLVPSLTNLRFLIPPMNATRLDNAVRRIASSPHTPCPALSKLVLVSFPAANGNCSGMYLRDVAIYAAIPSVKRVVVSHGRSYSLDGDFYGWPAGLPLSHAAEVYFDRATIIPMDVRRFAGGFAGPCVMRQWWVEHGSNLPEGRPDVEWDYLQVIPASEERGRDIVMELRYPDAHGDQRYHETCEEYSDEMNAMLQSRLWDWRKL